MSKTSTLKPEPFRARMALLITKRGGVGGWDGWGAGGRLCSRLQTTLNPENSKTLRFRF